MRFTRRIPVFKYLLSNLLRYLKTGILRVNLILNHLIILFNVFGDATIPLLMYKLDKEYWSLVKTFLLYLNRYPEYPADLMKVDADPDVAALLEDL